MFKNLLQFFLIITLSACETGPKSNQRTSYGGKVELKFLDSLVVESLFELYLADKNEDTDQLLFNGKQMKELIITDLEGEIISRFEPTGKGPNQVMSPLEVAFWQEGIVIKETSSEFRFNFFNRNFKKIDQSPALAKGINFLTIYNSFRSFSVFEKNGKSLILGEDLNLIDEQLLTENFENQHFYERAEIGYVYDLDSKGYISINLYPESWKPRLEQEWVGMVNSYVQVSKTDKKVAVLPSFGKELFFYRFNGTSISLEAKIPLFHPDRNDILPFDPKEDYVLYPSFTQLFSGGNYFLVEFYTELPREIYDSFRAKGDDSLMNPEYLDVLEKHRKVKYIVIDTNGNQGAISELPVPGVVHLIDAKDILYIKPTSKTELDYNVFYRYQMTLK